MTVYRASAVGVSELAGEESLITFWRHQNAAGSCYPKPDTFAATAGERPPHKETQTYGCCVSTLTRFVRPPLQRPLTGSPASNGSSFVRRTAHAVKGCPRRSHFRRHENPTTPPGTCALRED